MDKRSLKRMERELRGGAAKATKQSVQSIADRMGDDEKADLSRRMK